MAQSNMVRFLLDQVINSFEYCGITAQNKLHSALQQMITTKEPLPDFADNIAPSDEIYGFDPDDPDIFEIEIKETSKKQNVIEDDEDEEIIEFEDEEEEAIDELDDDVEGEQDESDEEVVDNVEQIKTREMAKKRRKKELRIQLQKKICLQADKNQKKTVVPIRSEQATKKTPKSKAPQKTQKSKAPQKTPKSKAPPKATQQKQTTAKNSIR